MFKKEPYGYLLIKGVSHTDTLVEESLSGIEKHVNYRQMKPGDQTAREKVQRASLSSLMILLSSCLLCLSNNRASHSVKSDAKGDDKDDMPCVTTKGRVEKHNVNKL